MSSTSSGSAQTGAPAFVVTDDGVRFVLDTTIYRVTAIQKVGYRLAQRFTLALGIPDGTRLPVTLLIPPGARANAPELVREFYQELCDQELRETIAEQTKDVRALLLAHAFSRTNLVRRE